MDPWKPEVGPGALEELAFPALYQDEGIITLESIYTYKAKAISL